MLKAIPIRRSYFFPLITLAATLIASSAALRAQDVRASLTGLITDPSGSPVSGATITATNIDTQVASTATSNDVGNYMILFLIPGHYTVDIGANGFKRFVTKDLTLSTSEHGTIDAKLDVGSVSESVDVNSSAPLLETTTASRSDVVSAEQIVSLPNNARNIYNLILAMPGVTKQDTGYEQFSNYGLINSTRISINGGVTRENETVIDGVVDTQPDGTVTFQPPLESVAEINVLTSNYDAAYGRFGGGVTAINTKAGTNALHGSLFEYHTNSALAANYWAYDYLGVPKPKGRANIFGFEIDAPVVIPKVFNGKNRLFFMLSYEGQRVNQAGSSGDLPTAAMKAGDFYQVPRTIYDPLTTQVVNGQAVRTPFSGNQIPANRINPISAKLLGYLPNPTLPITTYGITNYLSPVGAIVNYDLWLGRIDYRINDRNRIFFSSGQLLYTTTQGILFPNSPADVSTEDPLQRNFYRDVLDWTNTLDATTVLDLRVGYVRYVSISGNPLALGFNNASLGIDPALVAQQRIAQFPRFDIGGFYTPIGGTSPQNNGMEDTQSYQANLAKSIGRHQLKLGAEFRIYNDNTQSSGYGGGDYQFSNGFTQANALVASAQSGDQFASFLLGYPSGGEMDLNIDPAFQNKYYAVFAQDDFRLNHRISLNFGLRWDYESPAAERFNRMVTGFGFNQTNPLAAQISGLQGGLLYANSSNRYATKPDYNNVQPRIGVAIQVAKNWVVRGGYGLYYMATFATQPTTGYSAITPLVSSADGGLTPLVSLQNAFPAGLTQPVGNSQGLGTNLGQAVTFNYGNSATPWAHQVSLDIQHVFQNGIVTEAAYSGNFTRGFPVSDQLNSIPKDQLGMPTSYYTQQVANPFQHLLPLNPSMNGATVPRQDLLVPYPQFTSVTMNGIPIGQNDYNALQTKLTKRYQNGLTFNLGYVWSKTLQEMSFLNPQDINLQSIHQSKLERVLTPFDVPHRFTALVTYDLPFGRNRLFLQNTHGIIDKLVSGWQVDILATLQSGFPAPFPNAPNLSAESAKLPSDQSTLFHAFNTSLFPTVAPNLQYTYRTWPTYFPDVRLRPLTTFDLGLSKKTAITERLRFELRAEAYNAPNTPWFNTLNSQGSNVSSSQFGWYNLSSASNRTITLVGKLIW